MTNGRWTTPSELDPDATVDQLVFLDERRGLAFYHTVPAAAAQSPDVYDELRAQDIWMTSTADAGGTWSKPKTLGKGAVFSVSAAPKGPLFIVQVAWGKGTNRNSQIRVSQDGGMSFRDVATPADIVGVQFLDAQRGYAWTPRALFHTQSAGERWEPVPVPAGATLQTFRPSVHPDGSVFYTHGTQLFHLTPDASLQWHEVIDDLPAPFKGEGAWASDKGVWIVGRNATDRGAHLFRWRGEGNIEQVSSLSLPPKFGIDAIFSSGSVLSVSGADYGGDAVLAPVTLFRSEDLGKSWSPEVPKIRGKARPIAFYGPTHIWAVGTGNRVQHRE